MDDNQCPTCSQPAIEHCRCPKGERTCKNLHTWHICSVHGVRVVSTCDHTLPLGTCSCRQE